MNSFGFTGKLGSGSTGSSSSQNSQTSTLRIVSFVSFRVAELWVRSDVGGLHGRRHEYTPPTVQKWKELFGGSCCLWVGSPRGLVRGFGNEGVVLNEGAGDYSFRPVDSELDECKRDPLVAWLDDAGLAENNFLRYEVMREAVSFTCHEAPPVCG